jgi:WD40 repeat protein
VALEGLEPWGAQVLEDLWAAIERQLDAAPPELDAHGRERAYHERFLSERTDLFYGREALLATMLAYAGDADDRRPLALTGAPGSGKSALMAECARRCREQYPTALVLPHFVGVAPGSAALPATLRSICETLRRECGLADEVPDDPDELRRRWPLFLRQAGAARPVILLIDALNQLESFASAGDRAPDPGWTLAWLPFDLPPGTRLLVSTLAGPALDALRERLSEDHVLPVPALPQDDRRALIAAHLGRRGKHLTPDQMERLLDTRSRSQAGLPLYLRVAVEELSLFGRYEALNARIDDLPATIPALFDQVLARLEHDHGRPWTAAILRWLAAARVGLLEVELLDLLERLEPGFSRMRWTRFYRALEFYLRRIEETRSAGLLDFYHDQLRYAVDRRYLGMDAPGAAPSEPLRETHRELARYFGAQARSADGWRIDRPRGLGELPYHQARSASWGALRETLSDFGFLEAKVGVLGVQAAIADYDLVTPPLNPPRTEHRGEEEGASTPSPADLAGEGWSGGLLALQSALRQSAQVIARDSTQLAPQLLGRLLDHPSADVQRVVAGAAAWRGAPWLRPLTSSLARPEGQLRLSLTGYGGTVRSLALTPDGRWGITASNSHLDHNLRLWDFQAGVELHTLYDQADASGYNPVALTPDGRWALCARGDEVHVWDVATGSRAQPHATLAHGAPVTALDVAAEGARALSAAADGSLVIWNLRTWEREGDLRPPASIEGGAREAICALSTTADGRWAASAAPGVLRAWDLDARQQIAALPGDTGYSTSWLDRYPLRIAPEGDRVLYGSTLRIWHVGRASSQAVPAADTSRLFAIAADRRAALTSPDGQALDLWDLAPAPDGPAVRRAALPGQGKSAQIAVAALTPDASTAVVAYYDHSVKVWDLAARASAPAPVRSEPAMTVTPDGYYALLLERGRAVEAWDLQTGRLLPASPARDAALRAFEAQRQARAALWARIHTTLEQGTRLGGKLRVRVERWLTRRRQGEPESGWPEEGTWLLIETDGQWAIERIPEMHKTSEAAEEGPPIERYALRLWRLDAPRKPTLLVGHSSPVNAVRITPDGRRAISASVGHTLRVWDLKAGQEQRALRGHTSMVWNVAVLPDGRHAVSASEDRTLRLWNLDTGETVATYSGDLPLKSCAAGLNGQAIAACDSLGQVHILGREA